MKFVTWIARQSVLRDYLRDARRIAAKPGHYLHRKRILSELPPPLVTIPMELGFAITEAGIIPGLLELQAPLRALAERKFGEIDRKAFDAGVKRGSVKPFYFNLIDRKDVIENPQMLTFALSLPLLSIVAQYSKVMPELSHMAIFYSGLTTGGSEVKVRGTQVPHWDNHDRGHIKFFNFLDNVGENDGPLTVLPAEKSWWLRKKTGRRFGTWPVRNDAEFYRYFSGKDLIPIIGTAGTAAFVDTTRCLHFGSRTLGTGRRRTFVVHYTRFADYSKSRTETYQDLNLATSPECRAAVSLDRYGATAYRLAQRLPPPFFT